MVKAIINNSNPAWYCNGCGKAHGVLYIEGKKHYCPNCVPPEVKEQAVYENQNQEIIGEVPNEYRTKEPE